MNRASFSGHLRPGCDSTPDATSTPAGRCVASSDRMVAGFRPPARIVRLGAIHSATRSLPAHLSFWLDDASVSSIDRERSIMTRPDQVWQKDRQSRHRTVGLDPLASNDPRGLHDDPRRFIQPHAHSDYPAGKFTNHRSRHVQRAESTAWSVQHKSERIRPEGDGQRGIIEVRQAANLDPCRHPLLIQSQVWNPSVQGFGPRPTTAIESSSPDRLSA